MDRKELEKALKPFRTRCAEKAFPLSDITIEEAYPGDRSTSFIVLVKAPWIKDMSCYEALDFLFDTLWETTDEETRRNVFTIKVIDTNNELNYETNVAIEWA